MAERTILVCDVCGKPAAKAVSIRANGKTLSKDLCETHLAELVSGARPARRGRPRGTTIAAKPRRKATAAKSVAKRGRPRRVRSGQDGAGGA
jgi:hypothetical protein